METKSLRPEISQDAGRWVNLMEEIREACRGWLGERRGAAAVLAGIGDTTPAELAKECLDDGWLNAEEYDDETGDYVHVPLCTHAMATVVMGKIIDRLREELELELADASSAPSQG